MVVLLASACAGGDGDATGTLTVTTAKTVTVTTTTGKTPAPTPATTAGTSTGGTPPTRPRLPFPLPPDGTLPVAAFNAYMESVDEPWERDLAALTDAFVDAAASDVTQRSFQATSSGASASASLTLGGLLDDSVRARRYELELESRGDGTWTIAAATWSQRCQEGRGHQTFSPRPCL